MNTIQLRGQDRVTGELSQSSAGTKSQALPAAGNWSTWSAYHCDPRCSLLHPPHSHFPAQEARAEHGGGGCSTPRHYHQPRPGSGVLPGSTGSWWVMPLLTSQEQCDHHSTDCDQHHWQVSPGSLDLDTSPLIAPRTGQGQSRQKFWTLTTVEIIRGSCITMGLNSVAWDLAFLASFRPQTTLDKLQFARNRCRTQSLKTEACRQHWVLLPPPLRHLPGSTHRQVSWGQRYSHTELSQQPKECASLFF